MAPLSYRTALSHLKCLLNIFVSGYNYLFSNHIVTDFPFLPLMVVEGSYLLFCVGLLFNS